MLFVAVIAALVAAVLYVARQFTLATIAAVVAVVCLILALLPALDDEADAAPAPGQAAVDVGVRGDTPLDQLPACNPGPFDQERSRADDAPDPMSPEARVCKAEPTSSVRSTLAGGEVPPPNSTGYHFSGQLLDRAAHWQGARQAQRVVNPNVCHEQEPQSNPTDCFVSGQSLDFVASWSMITNFAGVDKFMQAGWSENSSGWTEFPGDINGTNIRQVFSFATDDGEWLFFHQFGALATGIDMTTSVRLTASSGLGWQYTTYLWWNGVWNALDSAWLDIDPNGAAATKTLEYYVEVHVDPRGPVDNHPQWDNSGNLGAHLYKRDWFHTAYGWVDLAVSDVDQTDVSPPYWMFLNFGVIDVTVCSEPDRATC